MSNAVGGLMNILVEIETYNESQIPPYRHEEVATAELALASARVDYRALLLHHKMSIEKSVESISRLRLQLDSDIDQEPLPTKGADADLEAARQREEETLRRLTAQTLPEVALAVLTSRFQQLERGLRIYKYKRALRIMNLAFDLCLSAASLDEATASKLTPTEQKLLATLRRLLTEKGLHNRVRDLPPAPTSDRGRAWVEPAVWLVESLEKVKEGVENLSAAELSELQEMAKAARVVSRELEFGYGDLLPTLKS